MSEAVNSDVLSVGKLDIQCDLSPSYDPILLSEGADRHDARHSSRLLLSTDCGRFSHSRSRTQANFMFKQVFDHIRVRSIGHIALNLWGVLEVRNAALDRR